MSDVDVAAIRGRRAAACERPSSPEEFFTATRLLVVEDVPALLDALATRDARIANLTAERDQVRADSAAADAAAAKWDAEWDDFVTYTRLLRATLGEVLRTFDHHTRPGDACLQSGRVAIADVYRWWAIHGGPVPARVLAASTVAASGLKIRYEPGTGLTRPQEARTDVPATAETPTAD